MVCTYYKCYATRVLKGGSSSNFDIYADVNVTFKNVKGRENVHNYFDIMV